MRWMKRRWRPVKCDVHVVASQVEGALSATVEVLVEGGKTQLIPMTCESLEPKLRFNTSTLRLGELYVGVPFDSEIIVSNITPFPTAFTISGSPIGEAGESCRLATDRSSTLLLSCACLSVRAIRVWSRFFHPRARSSAPLPRQRASACASPSETSTGLLAARGTRR